MQKETNVTKDSNTVDLDQDICEIGDIAMELGVSLEKANLMVQELTEYFNEFDRDIEKDRFCIAYEYDRNRIKSEIARDYNIQTTEAVENLGKLADELFVKNRENKKKSLG